MQVKFGSVCFTGDQRVLWVWPFTPQTLPSQHLQPSELPRALVGLFLPVLWHTHHTSVLLRDFSGLLLLLLNISSFLIARKQISPSYFSHLIVFRVASIGVPSMFHGKCKVEWRVLENEALDWWGWMAPVSHREWEWEWAGQARHTFHSSSARVSSLMLGLDQCHCITLQCEFPLRGPTRSRERNRDYCAWHREQGRKDHVHGVLWNPSNEPNTALGPCNFLLPPPRHLKWDCLTPALDTHQAHWWNCRHERQIQLPASHLGGK